MTLTGRTRHRAVRGLRLLLLALAAFPSGLTAQVEARVVIAGHPARFDTAGHLLPWIGWTEALDREVRFYRSCPIDHGYPRFVTETFLLADCSPDPERSDTIPATQNGMGIVSYLKMYTFGGRRDAALLDTARAMGDYLLNETLTPASGKYPRFPRSTGKRGQFPLAADAGLQADHPYEIEPDKGGIAGYALVVLFEAGDRRKYLDAALHIARVLAANQVSGDGAHSPWPFRVDFRTGAARGPISSNMTYILRLYDSLLARGYREFAVPRKHLWQWIKTWQIPAAASGGALFAQFFEDHDSVDNRNAWAPLNLARYLLEGKSALDADWLADAGALIDFVRANFTHTEFGVTVCHEQDEDHEAWNGVNATYGAVLALYSKAIGSAALASEARQALDFTLYSIDADGRPRDLFKHSTAGGWQEDAHTDVVHNVVDALAAFPDWADSH
jgi:hypothetical protein